MSLSEAFLTEPQVMLNKCKTINGNKLACMGSNMKVLLLLC